MATITAQDVKTLRDKTGAGMMDCKNALVDADGDMEKAGELLRERGIAKAVKKEGRIAAEGAIGSYVEGNVGVLVEVNCESDFVSGGDRFKALVAAVAKTIAACAPADVDALMDCPCEGETVGSYITNQTAVIGEKISVRRFERWETEGRIETYIHMGGSKGVIVEACPYTDGSEETLHDVALQIVGMSASYINEADVPAEVIEKEKEIALVQMQNDPKNAGKPTEILEKMLTGKIKKFYSDNCLMEQAFFKDESRTMDQVIGGKFSVKRFVRWEMGEGLEKKTNDLNAEVAEQVAAMKKG